jgi:hypothetical protein
VWGGLGEFWREFGGSLVIHREKSSVEAAEDILEIEDVAEEVLFKGLEL